MPWPKAAPRAWLGSSLALPEPLDGERLWQRHLPCPTVLPCRAKQAMGVTGAAPSLPGATSHEQRAWSLRNPDREWDKPQETPLGSEDPWE